MKTASPLRLRRLALGLTLAAAAKSMRDAGGKPASATALHEWETGVRPVPDTARKALARVLRVRRLP